MRIAREDILARFYTLVAEGKPTIGIATATAAAARCAEAGGVDFAVLHHSTSPASLLCYGDANGVLLDAARETLAAVHHTPVLAGVCGTDPSRPMDALLPELTRLGFSGVQNYPSVGLIDKDSVFRQHLEESGTGFDREVEMIRRASELGLLTTPFVFDIEDAVKMAGAWADVLVAHLGLPVKGRNAVALEECPARVQAIRDAAAEVNPRVLVLCHGGPLSEPKDAEYVLQRTRGVAGFFAAGSMERVAEFKAIRLCT